MASNEQRFELTGEETRRIWEEREFPHFLRSAGSPGTKLSSGGRGRGALHLPVTPEYEQGARGEVKLCDERAGDPAQYREKPIAAFPPGYVKEASFRVCWHCVQVWRGIENRLDDDTENDADSGTEEEPGEERRELPYLRFAPEHIEPIRNGGKTITARIGFERVLRPGELVAFIDGDGEAFGVGRIQLVGAMNVSEFVRAAFDGHRRYGSPEEFIDELGEYYPDERIARETNLTVIKFRYDGSYSELKEE